MIVVDVDRLKDTKGMEEGRFMWTMWRPTPNQPTNQERKKERKKEINLRVVKPIITSLQSIAPSAQYFSYQVRVRVLKPSLPVRSCHVEQSKARICQRFALTPVLRIFQTNECCERDKERQ